MSVNYSQNNEYSTVHSRAHTRTCAYYRLLYLRSSRGGSSRVRESRERGVRSAHSHAGVVLVLPLTLTLTTLANSDALVTLDRRFARHQRLVERPFRTRRRAPRRLRLRLHFGMAPGELTTATAVAHDRPHSNQCSQHHSSHA